MVGPNEPVFAKCPKCYGYYQAGEGHECAGYSRNPEADQVDEAEREPSELRIEALRAASRVVAGLLASGIRPEPGEVPVPDTTMNLAELFAEWLEGGR